MNLIKMAHELIDNKNHNKMEIARILYILTCEVFSYDYRYTFTEDDDLKESLTNRQFDLNNITEFNIICTNWSVIYQNLLDEFCIGNYTKNANHAHPSVMVEDDNFLIEADATLAQDLSRAKVKNTINGFKSQYDRINYQEMDIKIGYINDSYFIDNIFQYKSDEHPLIILKKIYNEYKNKLRFGDFIYLFDYIILKLKLNVYNREYVEIEPEYTDMKMAYYIDNDCFILEQKNNELSFYQVPSYEYIKKLYK